MSQPAHLTELSDFWGVTSFFSNGASQVQWENLRLSAADVRRQGLSLLIVEMALGGDPFIVPDDVAEVVVRVRTDTLLWQKERLLNIGFDHLPATCRFVAWLDADVIFENDQWVAAARTALEQDVVIQPFETICLLPAGAQSAPHDMPVGVGVGLQLGGFARTVMEAADRRRTLLSYDAHGHTGLAWAARRDFVARHGLYDRAIVGGGDLIAAHAFAADEDFLRWRTYCSTVLAKRERAAVTAWARDVIDETRGRMGWIPGRGLHLHHGSWNARRYESRTQILKDEDFDPTTDIALNSDGCWRWNSDKPMLHRRVAEYFAGRRSLTPA